MLIESGLSSMLVDKSPPKLAQYLNNTAQDRLLVCIGAFAQPSHGITIYEPHPNAEVHPSSPLLIPPDEFPGLTLKLTHFVSYRIIDPSSTLNPKFTIAFPVKNYYCKGPFPKP